MGRRAPIKELPSQEELLNLFAYDKESGTLTWGERPGVRGFKSAGKMAGTVSERGYLVVGIRKRYYLAHRIIWKMMTGCDPVDQVDHIDGNRLNNAWINLRPADNGLNICNSKIRSDNSSGAKGVCWESSRRTWRVVIRDRGVSYRIGRFKDFDDAVAAANAARLAMHGDFARLA